MVQLTEGTYICRAPGHTNFESAITDRRCVHITIRNGVHIRCRNGICDAHDSSLTIMGKSWSHICAFCFSYEIESAKAGS